MVNNTETTNKGLEKAQLRYDVGKALSGLKKIRYDKEHEKDLVQYEMTRAELKSLLSEGEKITPKAWRTEREQLESEMPELRGERARACHDLAFAEVQPIRSRCISARTPTRPLRTGCRG